MKKTWQYKLLGFIINAFRFGFFFLSSYDLSFILLPMLDLILELKKTFSSNLIFDWLKKIILN